MATSKITLWNEAVGLIGGNAKGLILSVDEEGSLADHCRAFHREAVDRSITFLRPVEATKFVGITATSDTVAKSDWSYAFSLPADYLDLVKYTDEDDRTINTPFEIKGAYILSDTEDCYIEYIHKMDYEDTTEMSPFLKALIAANLAVMIAPFIKPAMLQIAEAKLARMEQRAGDMAQRHTYEEVVTSNADIR